MNENELPLWARLLCRERRSINQPSLRELSNWTNIPPATIGRWFRALSTPPLAKLNVLMSAMDIDEPVKDEIREDIGLDRSGVYQSTPGPKPEPDVPARSLSDTQALAEAINNLADAIRLLAKGAD